MKKLFFALVTAFALISFASCGGNSSKGSKDAGDGKPTTEEGTELSNEEYAVEMFKKMYAAGEADDLEKFTKLAKEFDAWLNDLSVSEQKKVEKAVMAWDEEKAEQVIDAANEILY